MSSAEEPTRAAARAVRRRAAPVRRLARGAATSFFVVALFVFLLLAIGPRLMGYQTSTMLTGSMSPLINAGDVVVTVPVPVGEVKVGDVITYHIPVEDHRVETHRVIDVGTTSSGSIAVETKGDANNGKDPWTAALAGETVDRHVATIPYLGTVIRTLRQPVLMNTLMYGASTILVIGMLFSIWRKDPEAPVQATTGERANVHA